MMTASMTTSLPACLHKQRPGLSAARSPFFRQSCLLRQPILRLCQRRSANLDSENNVTCQHTGAKVSRRPSRSYTPEIVTEEESVSPWKRFAAFLLKSTAVAALAFALTFGSVLSADAASSGGRMGGSSFGAARSGGSSMGSSFGGSRSGGSLGSGMGSAPRLGSSSGYSSFLGPGIAGGYGYGYNGGFGGPVVVQRSDGGGGLITIVVLVAAFLLVTQVASRFLGGGDGDNASGAGRATVAKLQVGLLGSARSLQRDLERIAGRADTNTPDGLHYVLQETVLSLLRNPDYCVYGDGDTKNPRGLDGAEEAFNEVVMEERGKFKEETLVNVGGRSRRSSLKSRGDGMSELIVVTIVVASEGGVKVPKISSREQLKTSLNKLGALRSEQILAVEVMWTPQDENDSYTRDELFLDYPTLNTL